MDLIVISKHMMRRGADPTRAARGHLELHDHGRPRVPRAAVRERGRALLGRGRGGPHARRRAPRAQRPERRARAPLARLRDPARRATAHARRQEPQGKNQEILSLSNYRACFFAQGCLFSLLLSYLHLTIFDSPFSLS